MTNKKRIFTSLAVVAVVAFCVGVGAIAAGTAGSQSDPLVTLSYVNNKVMPEVKNYADSAALEIVDGTMEAVDSKLNDFSADIDAKLANGTVYDESVVFTEVKLAANETVKCGTGSEIMLRAGSTVTAGIILADTSKGDELENSGAKLEANHMYVAVSEGSIRAGADGATLLIKRPQ